MFLHVRSESIVPNAKMKNDQMYLLLHHETGKDGPEIHSS